MSDLVIVGSGLFGLTIADLATKHLGIQVLIVEKRNHIGGNAYSEIDPATGIEYHKYGSHIFHTSNEKVWGYVNQFTSFNNYIHKVWASHKGDLYEMPINLNTINKFFNLKLDSLQAEKFLGEQVVNKSFSSTHNFESRAISLIGIDLYNAFIKNYTLKQWQTDPRELPAEVFSRLPIRFTQEHRYFNDKYEGIPVNGYANWLENMADNPRITVSLEKDFITAKESLIGRVPIVYTGPIDRYFNFEFGQLGWRTLDFDYEVKEMEYFQCNSVINYSDIEVDFTRIHEFKHFHPERVHNKDTTLISKEFSRFADLNDEPYYPVNTAQDRSRLLKYRDMQKSQNLVWFGGRLGSYQYLDMHMAIASAMSLFENKIKPSLHKGKL